MAQNRPDKPSVTLPDDFGGTKEAFSSSLVESGYEASIPQIVEGGNLNYMLDGLFQNTKYMRAVLDYVRDTPVGKMFWVNSNGQMDYVQPSIIATDTEFSTGTATDKTPNVKQVVDNLQPMITGGASTVTSNNLTANRAIYSNASGKIAVSSVTSDELGYLSGVTSAVQTQLNAKAADNAVVKLTGNQTIAGTKTFSTTPVVQTQANSDSSTKAASTAYVHNILSALYPVGSIYIGTQSTCPLSSLISGSSWSLVAQNKALWGGTGSNGNTTIAAGLPNITGRYNHQCLLNWISDTEVGALYTENKSTDTAAQYAGGSDGGNKQTIAFDASKSNSIYGNSTTVQPPAYRVNVWRRTA